MNDEDGAEIVYVGQGRSGDDLVAESFEEAVAVIVGKARLGVDPSLGCAGQCVGSYDGAGDLFGSIDAVGIAGQCEHARQAVQFDGERKQKFDVAASASASFDSDGGFASGQQDDWRRALVGLATPLDVRSRP